MKFYKENQVNPARLLSPARAAVAGLHLAVLHAADGPQEDICPEIAAEATAAETPCTQHDVSHAADAPRRLPCGPDDGASFLFIPDLTDKATGAVLIA